MEKRTEKIPLPFVIGTTAAFLSLGLLTVVYDLSPVLVSVLFMGGLAAYIEYHMRTNAKM